MNAFVAELKKEVSKFRDTQERKQKAFMKKQKKQEVARRTENSPLRNDDFYWTDAPKYAEKYYGETYRATTQYDNDWGDY